MGQHEPVVAAAGDVIDQVPWALPVAGAAGAVYAAFRLFLVARDSVGQENALLRAERDRLAEELDEVRRERDRLASQLARLGHNPQEG